jgi:hypothetical protein
VEVDGKRFTGKTFELVNHKTHIFARDKETKHPSGEMKNIEIFGYSTKASLKDQPNGILIKPDRRSTKTCNQMESRQRAGWGVDRLTEQLKR